MNLLNATTDPAEHRHSLTMEEKKNSGENSCVRSDRDWFPNKKRNKIYLVGNDWFVLVRTEIVKKSAVMLYLILRL